MIVSRKALDRRTFLRGAGTAIALPFLDAMVPAFSRASAAKPPVRMGFVYVPNGIIPEAWNPDYTGPIASLPRILKPLEPFKQDILLLRHLTANAGRAWQDGAGDHGRCCGAYLTGVHVKKTLTDIHSGVSCDQLVANQIGSQTRFPSLEIGIEDARQAGNCDSGYSCAYTNNLAWKSPSQPLPPILNPRALFERLFGSGEVLTPEARARQNFLDRSIVDFALADTKRLESGLGAGDRRKLDEYLSSVREIERQIDRAEKDDSRIDPHMDKPFGIPADFGEHFKLMSDMMTVALQTDMTRVFTFIVTREGTSRPYREIGISDGHHPLTHHRNQPDLIEKVTQVNTYHVKQLAAWVEKLKSIREGDGTLLDNLQMSYGASLADGNRHTHEDLPTVIVGRAGNRIKPGRIVAYQKETPQCNLFLTMMDNMGVRMEQFGDSTGRLAGVDLT